MLLMIEYHRPFPKFPLHTRDQKASAIRRVWAEVAEGDLARMAPPGRRKFIERACCDHQQTVQILQQMIKFAQESVSNLQTFVVCYAQKK